MSVTELKIFKHGEHLPDSTGMLNDISTWINKTAFIEQPDFAFSASLVFLSTLMGRKFIFQGMAPNLYVLNVAPSGSGKDNCQQKLKQLLSDINTDYLLGSGDYISDASLMDSLDIRPTRLDIMDECGSILKSMTSGKADYNRKMGDILTELYTSSTSKYLGRATADGNKGACTRPNVNILGSTTPVGFSEGISRTAIEKGLFGRMLVFMGDGNKPAKRVKDFPRLDINTLAKLRYLASYKPPESDWSIGGLAQEVYEITATDRANELLDTYFKRFDDLRMETEAGNVLLPIICRLYQQMVKLTMIHAVSRTKVNELPEVDEIDVEFGYRTMLYCFGTLENIVEKHIYDGKNDAIAKKFINHIRSSSPCTKSELTRTTRWLDKRNRDNLLSELVEGGDILITREEVNNRNQLVIKWIGE